MARRFRDFKRIAMNAKTARRLVVCLVDKTFQDHLEKCGDLSSAPCPHVKTLPVARAFEAGIKIGDKRATLDVACPYSTKDPRAQIELICDMALRIDEFAERFKRQQFTACLRISEDLRRYASRNPMQVIAEAAL